jgi:hypothetical protein
MWGSFTILELRDFIEANGDWQIQPLKRFFLFPLATVKDNWEWQQPPSTNQFPKVLFRTVISVERSRGCVLRDTGSRCSARTPRLNIARSANVARSAKLRRKPGGAPETSNAFSGTKSG